MFAFTAVLEMVETEGKPSLAILRQQAFQLCLVPALPKDTFAPCS